VSQADYEVFRDDWQGCTAATRRNGPRGLAARLSQLAGSAHCADDWDDAVLRARVDQYRPELLDQATLSGEFVWLRLWGSWRGPLSKAPLSIVPRQDLPLWLQLPLERPDAAGLGSAAATLRELLEQHGASFPTDLQTWSRLLPSQLEDGLAELIGTGFLTADSFAVVRQLAVPPSRRRFPLHSVGRLQLVPWPAPGRASETAVEHCAQAMLARFGVVSQTLWVDERVPVPWRLVLRPLRALELAGRARGGRFVAGWTGEQFAAAEAVALLRRARRQAAPAGEKSASAAP
jgi:ATP-dependent Lhr-like helicase